MTEIISLVNDCVSEYFSVDKSCLYERVKNNLENDAKGFCWLILHDIYKVSHSNIAREYQTYKESIQRKIYKFRNYIRIYPEYHRIFNEIKALLDNSPL